MSRKGKSDERLWMKYILQQRHWVCLRCPAGYFCAWGDLPVIFPPSAAGAGHQHEWTLRAEPPDAGDEQRRPHEREQDRQHDDPSGQGG